MNTPRNPQRRLAGIANAKGLIAAAALIVTLGGWGAISANAGADQTSANAANQPVTQAAPATGSTNPVPTRPRGRQRRWQGSAVAAGDPPASGSTAPAQGSTGTTPGSTAPAQQPLARTRSSR